MTEPQYKWVKEAVIGFIWNNRKSKISYNTLIQDKNNVGLGLCDLHIKSKALKVTWLQILHTEEKLQNLVS